MFWVCFGCVLGTQSQPVQSISDVSDTCNKVYLRQCLACPSTVELLGSCLSQHAWVRCCVIVFWSCLASQVSGLVQRRAEIKIAAGHFNLTSTQPKLALRKLDWQSLVASHDFVGLQHCHCCPVDQLQVGIGKQKKLKIAKKWLAKWPADCWNLAILPLSGHLPGHFSVVLEPFRMGAAVHFAVHFSAIFSCGPISHL